MSDRDKRVVWLRGEVKTPPFSSSARIEAGLLLRRLQRGELISLPHARPMTRIGARCHELRIVDEQVAWRIMYRIDVDAIVVLDVFEKKTRHTPQHVIESCKRRLRAYDGAERK